MDEGRLTLTRQGTTALVTIENPRKRNAMNPQMWAQWPEIMREATLDAGVRAIVLTGAQGHFCAGADIGHLDSIHDTELPEVAHSAIVSCPKPTIAAITGSCVGGGVQMAGACDLRIAGAASRFGVPPANLGIIYPLVPLKRLVQLIGPANTKYLVFTSGLVTAERAHHMGLVDEVLPDGIVLDRALRLADEIAGRSQLSLQATKDIVDRLVTGRLSDDRVAAWLEQVASSPDVAEGMAAFAERRRPSFTWNGAGLPD